MGSVNKLTEKWWYPSAFDSNQVYYENYHLHLIILIWQVRITTKTMQYDNIVLISFQIYSSSLIRKIQKVENNLQNLRFRLQQNQLDEQNITKWTSF